MSHERSRAEADTFRRVADITTDLLNNSELPRRSSIDDLRDDIEKLFEQHNLLDAGNAAAIKTISRNMKRHELLHTLARLMHKASLAESLPEPVSLEINTGAWVSSDLDNIAWLSMRDVNRAGTLTLEISDEKGQIKLPSGGSILWPAAIYEFNFSGAQGDSGYTDISLNFSGLGYGDAGKVRIYEVGKGLIRDVTTQVDTEREVVTGRVNTLGSYVLVEHF